MACLEASKLNLIVIISLSALLGACSSDSGSDGGSDVPDPAAIAAGEALVAKNVCKSCHGAADGTLSGQDKPQSGTKAYGVNLTPDTDTGLGDWTTDQIVTAILTGKDDEGEQLCTTMPVYGQLGMSDADARNLAAYLKSLAPVSHESPESTCD